jgi:hypothetical protein
VKFKWNKQAAPAPTPRTFVVKYRYVSMREATISAKDEAEARAKFECGEWADCQELDSLDSELVSIKEES